MRKKPLICEKHPELNGARYKRQCKGCALAHQKEVYANNPEAAARRKATNDEWRAKNREYLKAKNKEYRAKNSDKLKIADSANSKKRYALKRDEVLQKTAAWRRNNMDRYKELIAAWTKKNSDKCAAMWARRKATKLQATPAWANKFFIEEAYSLARLRTKCTGIKWSVDHIVPLISKKVCGLHVEHNLAVIPASENSRKSNLYWPHMA